MSKDKFESNTEKREDVLRGMSYTPHRLEPIYLAVKPTVMLDAYARELVSSAQFYNPQKFAVKPLDPDKMVQYCRFIIEQRLLQVEGGKVEWYKAKDLNIPDYLSQVLPSLGRVEYFQAGRLYMPMMDKEFASGLNYEKATIISGDLGYYRDTLVMFRDAFPRTKDGDYETFNCAIKEDSTDCVSVTTDVESHVAVAHAAFLGFSIARDTYQFDRYELKADSINWIKYTLLNSEEVKGIVKSKADNR